MLGVLSPLCEGLLVRFISYSNDIFQLEVKDDPQSVALPKGQGRIHLSGQNTVIGVPIDCRET